MIDTSSASDLLIAFFVLVVPLVIVSDLLIQWGMKRDPRGKRAKELQREWYEREEAHKALMRDKGSD